MYQTLNPLMLSLSILYCCKLKYVSFNTTGEVFVLHADVENVFGFPAGQLGKIALTVSRDEIWILTGLPIVCA